MGTYFRFVVEARESDSAPWIAVYDNGEPQDPDVRAEDLYLDWKCYGLHNAFRALADETERFGDDAHGMPADATPRARELFPLDPADYELGHATVDSLELLARSDEFHGADFGSDNKAWVERVYPGLELLADKCGSAENVRLIWGFS